MDQTESDLPPAAIRAADARLGAAESTNTSAENGYVDTPLAGTDFTARPVPANLNGESPHHQMCGPRLDPNAGGHLTARLPSPPSALRTAFLPEVSAMLERPDMWGASQQGTRMPLRESRRRPTSRQPSPAPTAKRRMGFRSDWAPTPLRAPTRPKIASWPRGRLVATAHAGELRVGGGEICWRSREPLCGNLVARGPSPVGGAAIPGDIRGRLCWMGLGCAKPANEHHAGAVLLVKNISRDIVESAYSLLPFGWSASFSPFGFHQMHRGAHMPALSSLFGVLLF